MPKPNRSSNNLMIALIMTAIIICTAIASWVFFASNNEQTRKNKKYRNITYTDALLTCQKYSYERYGSALKNLTLDNHSSRWEQKIEQYKLFFNAEIAGKTITSPTMKISIACDVSGRSGKVRDYDAQEDKSLKTKSERMKDGGLFGWP
ncbi:MAG: hypothetical protein U5M23_01920 [Marinagarivorans sp.]|nr:hypothetical protein [Marinagarivorans sp.]